MKPGWIQTLLGAAVGIVAWEVGAMFTPRIVWVPFSETVLRTVELFRTGELGIALLESAQVFGFGLVTSVVIGAPLGLLIARYRWLDFGLDPYITALYATPLIALIPIILTVFGFGVGPKVLVVVLFAVFPIVINTIEGSRSTPSVLIEVARSFRSTPGQVWKEVVVPYSLPFVMSGIRQAIARALVGTVAAEFFLSATGVGALLVIMSRRFDTAAILGTTLILTLVGVLLMASGRRLERAWTPWRVAIDKK